MPLYEYQCNACGLRTEELQRMSDAPLTTCKSCGGELQKLISSPAFQFKGTGWYVTDYNQNSSSENGDKPAKKEEETPVASSSESPKETPAKPKEAPKAEAAAESS